MKVEQSGGGTKVVENTVGCLERIRSGCLLIGFNLFFLFFIALFFYFGNRSYRLDQIGVIALGSVIGLDESDSAEGGCCVYSPMVEFSVDGQTFNFTDGNASDPPRYNVGDQVEVQYDPENPTVAEIEGGPGWLLWAGLIALFFVIMIVANIWGGIRIWRGESLDD